MPSRSVLLWTLSLIALSACSAKPGSVSSSSASKASAAQPPIEQTYARMEPSKDMLKPGDVRTFSVSYVGHVKDVPAGAKLLRVWMPVPQDNAVQKISELKFEGNAPKFTTEKKYGNKIAYWEIQDPGASIDITMSFLCTRSELVTDLTKARVDGAETDPAAKAFLADDKLTYVDDRIRKMAAEITAGKTTTLDKARAIYDYVRTKMTYDKSGTGWGRGDTAHACDVGKGNCTDFHALFMSLARASGIPAGFEIGLYLPYERKKDEKLGGYHCWSYFRIPGKTWVPVDISEASRKPELADYFFGSHTSNRVTLSVGRDLVLEPAQKGEPLNYFLNPHAEADGVPVTTAKDWTCQDLDA